MDSKQEFIQLLLQVDGGNDLITHLDKVGFFEAPASIKYHSAYPGGLVEHSIKVYNELVNLVNMRQLDYDNETLIKVALCHDICKADLYEYYLKNEKVDGQWVQRNAYRMREATDRYTVGDGGFTSYMVASRYISFTDEEIVAICNFNHIVNIKSYPECSSLLSKYPLTILLHEADIVATYIQESRGE